MDNEKQLSSQFWQYLISAILIALSGCLGNVVDGIIVGNLINSDGVSAINLSRPVVQFLFTLSLLIAGGAGMLVGFALGRDDQRRTRYVYTQAMIGNAVLGCIVAMAGFLFPDTLARMLCNNEHLYPMALSYLRIVLLGAPAYLFAWSLSTLIGVDNSPKLVSVAILVDNAVNLLLDIVFIKFFGWGIAGSSAATVVGHLVGIIIMCWHYFKPTNHLLLSLKHDAPEWGNIISQGAPLAVASVCLTLLLFAANSIVLKATGRDGIFVFAVCMNLLQIYNLFLAGTCRTLQSLGAIQVGRHDDDAFNFVLRKSFLFITVSMVVTCLYVWIFPHTIAVLFGAKGDDLIALSNHALRVFALSFIPFCYIYVFMIVYKLYGYHRMALFISFALSLTVIPVLWFIARYEPRYLWYSYLVAYIIEALIIWGIHRVAHIKFALPQV